MASRQDTGIIIICSAQHWFLRHTLNVEEVVMVHTLCCLLSHRTCCTQAHRCGQRCYHRSGSKLDTGRTQWPRSGYFHPSECHYGIMTGQVVGGTFTWNKWQDLSRFPITYRPTLSWFSTYFSCHQIRYILHYLSISCGIDVNSFKPGCKRILLLSCALWRIIRSRYIYPN